MNIGGISFATKKSLVGVRVMVTRASHQAAALSDMIEAAGGHAIRLPVLEIAGTTNPVDADHIISRLPEFDIAIFVSQNAVAYGHARILALGTSLTNVKLAAIGEKTAAALQTAGHRIDIYPREGFTTEDLLTLPGMSNVRGRRIMIFRGEGGRELLGATLRARGASVVYAEVYRRVVPHSLSAALRRCLETEDIDVITIASGEALQNLDGACVAEFRALLHQTYLLVGSARTRRQAELAGFRNIDVTKDPGDDAMFESLLQWASNHMPKTEK